MTLPTGQISMSQVNVELGRSGTAQISLGESAVRTLAGVASGTISMSNLQGKSNVSWSPDGGASAGSPVYLSSDVAFEDAVITITCNQSATWSYVKTGSATTGTANNASATSITFTVTAVFGQNRTGAVLLNSTAGGVTKYWSLDLRSDST